MAKILVVDDDDAIRGLVVFTLESYGHEVLQAADGLEAIETMGEQTPALVVLDVMMPGIDGWGVLREMRRSGLKAQTRVLMLTAKTREDDILMGWRLGIDDYVTKPFDPTDLARHVERTLLATREEIESRRARELEKATILSRIESLFDDLK